MSKQNDLIVDGINISSLRLHLEIGRKCTISTEEWLKVLDILEKLHQENKHLKHLIDYGVDFTEFIHTYDKSIRLQQENDELQVVNLRLLHRLEVDDKDVNLVYQLEKELDNKKSEWYTALEKNVEYEQVIKSIRGISDAIVNGVHFADNIQDLNEHFQILNQQILDIIEGVSKE